MHTLLCLFSQLPVMFLVTSGSRQEDLLAIPLLVLAVACYGFTFTIVCADAGYYFLSNN